MDPAKNIPISFFGNFEDVKKRLAGKEAIFFLDYDGTLTPIVATPDLAVLSDEMRETIRSLAGTYKVAIVSGRATDDVRGKVALEGIFYAGSHGFEIVSPDGKVTINEEVSKVRPVIDEVHEKLNSRLSSVKGALVEHVKYTISTHYRLVSDEDFPKIKQAVDDILKEYPRLRKTDGKKVFEIRPKIDWDKGKAVGWILNSLAGQGREGILPVYIGDDTTDEDAFRAIKDFGFGILVAEAPKKSEAAYWIKNTEEVKKVLELFVNNKEKTKE